MNNFILISRTYCETTPESTEHGDFSASGWVDECQQVTFSELVDLMKEHNEPSNSRGTDNIYTWYSTEFYTTCYRTGTDRQESIHFHPDNTANAAKYWSKARRYAENKS